MRFRKSILKVGRKVSPDGVVDVTPERLKHWATQFARLTKESDVPMVPIDWDHASTIEGLKPLSVDEYKKRRSAKNTVGHLAEFRLAPDEQSAELVFDVGDDTAIDKAKKNMVAVSPVIVESFKDGKGNEYQDLITHCDFVNHAVDGDQGPFIPEEQGTLACALRMGLSPALYRMADDKKDDDDSDDDGKDDDDELEDDAGRLKSVIEALGKMSIVLSDDTNTSNLLAHLHQALLTAAAHRGEDANDNSPNGDKTMVADPGAAGATALSLEARGAIAWAEKTHREQVTGRLQKVLDQGQCTPAEFKTRQEQTPAIKLSLDSEGKPAQSDLEKWLDSRESVPKGTFWDSEQRTRMSTTVEEPPANMRGELTAEETRAAADWALGRKTPAAKT
jgi:hypothetical protein